MRPPSRIALVGFMGSGKSTVARVLADALGFVAADSDLEIARDTGFDSPGEALRVLGEPRFREAELAAIRRVLAGESVVLATGGGAFAEPDTARHLLERAFVVHLACGLEEAVRRAGRRGGRPLLDRGPEAVAELFAARKDKYARAHVSVDTSGADPEAVTRAILGKLPGQAPPQ